MTDENTVKPDSTSKSEISDDEILSRAQKINEERELERIKEEQRLEEERLAKEAEIARQKQLEEEKRLEEVAKARTLVEEDNKKREDEARAIEAEKQAEILRAEEAKRAAEAKKAAELEAAKKLVEEDKKKNPEKKKHTGLKVTLVILLVLLVAILVAIFSFGVDITNNNSSGAINKENAAVHQIWLPLNKNVTIGNYFINSTQNVSNAISVTAGKVDGDAQTVVLQQNVPNNDIKDKHVIISLLWGLWKLQEFDVSINNMIYISTNNENNAYCTAKTVTSQPVTGESILLWALGLKGIVVK